MKTSDHPARDTVPTHITVAAAARLLGVSRATVNAMAMREQIVTEKIADRWLVVVSSLPADMQTALSRLT